MNRPTTSAALVILLLTSGCGSSDDENTTADNTASTSISSTAEATTIAGTTETAAQNSTTTEPGGDEAPGSDPSEIPLLYAPTWEQLAFTGPAATQSVTITTVAAPCSAVDLPSSVGVSYSAPTSVLVSLHKIDDAAALAASLEQECDTLAHAAGNFAITERSVIPGFDFGYEFTIEDEAAATSGHYSVIARDGILETVLVLGPAAAEVHADVMDAQNMTAFATAFNTSVEAAAADAFPGPSAAQRTEWFAAIDSAVPGVVAEFAAFDIELNNDGIASQVLLIGFPLACEEPDQLPIFLDSLSSEEPGAISRLRFLLSASLIDARSCPGTSLDPAEVGDVLRLSDPLAADWFDTFAS